MNIEELKSFVKKSSIEDFYKFVDYDYANEIGYSGTQVIEERRLNFIKLFNWKIPPTRELILRVFNQVNTYYAEELAFNNVNNDPIGLLNNCNELILFRQNKELGFRSKPISYGLRSNVDFYDPLRNIKWLYGMSPKHIADAMSKWQHAVDNIKPSRESALFLTMAFIGIHPYSDGNGRMGRLAFTWLHKLWKLDDIYLNEGDDGELLRTGYNIDSTEYMMGSFILELFNNLNEIVYPYRKIREDVEEEQAFETFSFNLDSAVKDESKILNNERFKKLSLHLNQFGHIISYSPRFKCLYNSVN